MPRFKVFTIYIAEHEFQVREDGRWMADTVRERVTRHDRELGDMLRFDPEADGVAIAAPSRALLESAIAVCVTEGLFKAKVLDRLHPDLDDVAIDIWDAEPNEAVNEDGPHPLLPVAATDRTVTALFTTSSYLSDDAPTFDTAEMANITRQAIAAQHWSDPVTVSLESDWGIRVEAETSDRLDQIARLIGLPGIEAHADETFDRLRTSTLIDAPTLADPPWEVTTGHWSASPFEARGILSDVPGHRGFEATSEGLGTLAEHLAAADHRRAETISIEPLESEIMIAGPTADDLEWALTILGIRPRAADNR